MTHKLRHRSLQSDISLWNSQTHNNWGGKKIFCKKTTYPFSSCKKIQNYLVLAPPHFLKIQADPNLTSWLHVIQNSSEQNRKELRAETQNRYYVSDHHSLLQTYQISTWISIFFSRMLFWIVMDDVNQLHSSGMSPRKLIQNSIKIQGEIPASVQQRQWWKSLLSHGTAQIRLQSADDGDCSLARTWGYRYSSE